MLPRLCPTCRVPLAASPGDSSCAGCGARYPKLGSVECLVAEPPAFCATWTARLERYCVLSRERAAQLTTEAQEPGTSAHKRERLTRLARALDAEQSALASLLTPLVHCAEPSARLMLESLVDDPLAITRYSEHIFRDWVWGKAENQRVLELIAPLLPGEARTVAVLGAGTGRLALDLALHRSSCEVYAFDINPVPLLVTDHLLTGAGMTLPEFPQFPLATESVAIWRSLQFEGQRPAGLHLLLADALQLPFEAGSFDAVLTPWFIDAVAVDVAETARAVSGALRRGGTWLNVGPLQFGANASRACSIDELLEVVGGVGFEVKSSTAHDLPYFESPVSGTRRIDRTYAFSAQKTSDPIRREGAPPHTVRAPAAFLGPEQPIPATNHLRAAQQQAVLTAGIAALVDGQRSLNDLAQALGRSWNVEPEQLLEPLAQLLARML